jgi:hypothetical protein
LLSTFEWLKTLAFVIGLSTYLFLLVVIALAKY